MKQYTTPEQTARLIELGFAPTVRIKEVRTVHTKVIVNHDCSFTIGDLIEILDTVNETVQCRFGGIKANLASTNSGYEKIGGGPHRLII